MPYKLKVSSVTLSYRGVGKTEDALELTFKEVGVTPQNKYAVWVDKESHLVPQWGFYPKVTDAEPRFTGPWSNWQRPGAILLCNERGKGQHTDVAVFDELQRSVFEDPAPSKFSLSAD